MNLVGSAKEASFAFHAGFIPRAVTNYAFLETGERNL